MLNSKSIGNYIVGKTLGEGTFGKVKLGRHILSGSSVAVKILQKDRITDVADVERVAREVHILKLLRHPHIVQLYEIIEARGHMYFIMEYASGGELFDYIVQKGRVVEPDACRFFHQIISGVEKIHEMNVVHRDLKPENVLLDENMNIKIVDFGLSNLWREGQRLNTACGSPCYAPPEMVAGRQYEPRLCDLWCCGVTLFALVCGFLPFEDSNTAMLYKKILAAAFKFPDFLSEEVKELITGLLTVDPEQRFTIDDVRASAWYCQIPEASIQPPDQSVGGEQLDEPTLKEMEVYGFPRDYIEKCLGQNKHNHTTTTYRLLQESKHKIKQQADKGEKKNSGSVVAQRTGTTPVYQGGQATPEKRQYCCGTSAPVAAACATRAQHVPSSRRESAEVCHSARGVSVVRRATSPFDAQPVSARNVQRYSAAAAVARGPNSVVQQHVTSRSPGPPDSRVSGCSTSGVGALRDVAPRRASPSPAPQKVVLEAAQDRRPSRKSAIVAGSKQDGETTARQMASMAMGGTTPRVRVTTPRQGATYHMTPSMKVAMTPRSGSAHVTPRVCVPAAVPQMSSRNSGARSVTPRATTPRVCRFGPGNQFSHRMPTSTTPTQSVVRRRPMATPDVVTAVGTPVSRMIWK